jgi:hypothetical protein
LWPVSGTAAKSGGPSHTRRPHVSSFSICAEILEYRQLLSVSVSAVSPKMAQTQGGTNVSVVGTDFTNVTNVMFGDAPARSWQVNSSSALTAVSPNHAAVAVDIQVITTAGSSPIDSTHDQFTFVWSSLSRCNPGNLLRCANSSSAVAVKFKLTSSTSSAAFPWV